MSDKKVIPVAMFGIPEHERNVLKNIFKDRHLKLFLRGNDT